MGNKPPLTIWPNFAVMTADESAEAPLRISRVEIRLALLHSKAQNADSHMAMFDRAVCRINRNSTTDTATAAP